MHLFQNLNDAKEEKLKKDNKIELQDDEFDENDQAITQKHLFVDPEHVNLEAEDST
jgi:hypothetical protein